MIGHSFRFNRRNIVAQSFRTSYIIPSVPPMPPPGRIPSSTAARVAERASSTRCFLSFGYTVGRLYPANHYPLITNIFLLGSFCGNNLNSRLVYHHGVQKALGRLCHKWRMSQETSGVGQTRSFYFRNHHYRSCCFQTCSAFLLRGIQDSAWAH